MDNLSLDKCSYVYNIYLALYLYIVVYTELELVQHIALLYSVLANPNYVQPKNIWQNHMLEAEQRQKSS